MNGSLLSVLVCLILSSCSFNKSEISAHERDVSRIVSFLSADDLQGRAVFTPGIDKAARFIESEFQRIGLKHIERTSGFLQQFTVTRIIPGKLRAAIDGKLVSDQKFIVVTDLEHVKLNDKSGLNILSLEPGKDFTEFYQKITASSKNVLVLVDEQYTDDFIRLRKSNLRSRTLKLGSRRSQIAIFVLGVSQVGSFNIDFNNLVESSLLANVVGVIPGRSKAHELVIFSAHYDHLGIVKPSSIKEYLKTWRIRNLSIDSIANGADDNASGVTAIISLADYYKKLNTNERTLVFVAFTAEEIGGFGVRNFMGYLDPSSVIAMFNIEMIGKQSKFGKNSAFITGFEKSDFGEILQRNLAGTQFSFHPDPYPKEKLFERSDNASLAALGIPAHTISTDQIDVDKFYHTVNDEYRTLDISNITATINAIALSSRSIVSGKDTPSRIALPTEKELHTFNF